MTAPYVVGGPPVAVGAPPAPPQPAPAPVVAAAVAIAEAQATVTPTPGLVTTTMAGSQTNTATLIMGPTGSGKSSLIATLARYVYAKYGKVTLLYSCDGGGIPMEIQKLVAAGIVRLWRMYTRDPGNWQKLAWDTMLKASQGWWPMEINPATGESPVGTRLMPPLATLHTMLCPNGHVVKQTTKSHELTPTTCPQCMSLVNDINMRVERTSKQPKFFEEVGAMCFDGITSMCAWGEADLGDRAGRSEIGGMDGAVGGKIISGDTRLGQTTMSHVGFTQQQARAIVLNTQGIPNLVVPPVFTALTLDATVEGTRVCGPQISGKAKTDVAPQWFGNCLEAEKREPSPGKYQFRLWLNQWRDPQGVVHLCKNRASPGVLPDYLEDPTLQGNASDKQTAFTRFSLSVFFELLQAALDEGVQRELDMFQRSAVKNEMVKFADPFADLVPAAPATTGPGTIIPGAPIVLGQPIVPGGASINAPRVPAAPAIPGAPMVPGQPLAMPSMPGSTLPAVTGALPTVAAPIPIAAPVAAAVAPITPAAPVAAGPQPVAAAAPAPPAGVATPTVAPPPGRRPMAPPMAAPIPVGASK